MPTRSLHDPVPDAVEGLWRARIDRGLVTPPSEALPRFTLVDAYRVGAVLDRRLRESGARRTGVKIGFTNTSIWRELGLDEPIVAPVYADTVADSGCRLSLSSFAQPRLEVEVVFGVGAPSASPEWVALGFEVVDCHFPDWRLTPADAVADYGLHARLIVGPRLECDAPGFEKTLAELDRLVVTLGCNGREVGQGRGADVMEHPIAALEAGSTICSRIDTMGRMERGHIVSTGTMTALASPSAGDTWRAVDEAGRLPSTEVRFGP